MMNRVPIDALGAQIHDRRATWGEMQSGIAGNLSPEPFFGETLGGFVGTQPRLHVPKHAPRTVRRARPGIRGERVPLDQHDLGTEPPSHSEPLDLEMVAGV